MNAPNSQNGMTSLMLASSGEGAIINGGKPMPDVMSLLLNRGARPNARNIAGQTALMLASGDAPARLLLARGASINARDWRGDTALMLATLAGDGDKAAALLEAGANFRLRNRRGQAALGLTLAPLAVSNGAVVTQLPALSAQQLARIERGLPRLPPRDPLEAKLNRALRGRAQIRRRLLAAGARE